ncbi:acetylornithine deacetylase [Enhydrobacter aerosaccus]|uniref:Acetylornithine deacetylase n=1 Tax=Enhydrobacter aerosaccus TaxID=225324 RepID=A0A1T4KQZ5_9HYPH|nr:acetylornithine deacetylase [Enhydrobacter aerosaccus]SJZ44822.1 acetylornithine deacetylase [Enhydrobacter aerosaccus]
MSQSGPSSIEMLKRLIAFDTTSRNSNLDLIQYIQGYLSDFGVESTLVPNEAGTKANLFASIGPDKEGGIVLSGHTDVVPVDGQPWTTDPWELTEKADGNLYGRGTSDMKGFIAVALSHVPLLQKAKLKVPIHLAFSYDEEIGCLGAPALVEKLVGNVPRPQAVIVGEPTMMGVVNAQNAGGGIIATFTGVEAHSSMTHLGVSAIHFAGDFIHWLNELQEELAQRKRTDIDTVPGHTTINVGVVSGGTAGNILARECVLNWGYRTLPGDDAWEVQRRAEKYVAELLLPKMRAKHPEANITLKRRSFVPGLNPQENEEAAKLALQWTGGNRTYAVPYGTEAGIFRSHGIPTVICGPGDISQAHQPNEFVARSQIDACDAFVSKMIRWAEK